MKKNDKKERFTPGPWHVVDTREEDDVDTDYEIADKYDWIVAVPGNDHLYIEEANAYLIACAPEMYDLLKRIKGMLEFCELEDKIDVDTEHEIGAILAKARGEVRDA